MAVLEGKARQAHQDAVIANAAMALYASNRNDGLAHAVEKAREALVSGKALETFRKLIGSQI
jgi:anthranilate phosphoribosyltransferase